MHLLSVNQSFQYDAIYALGVVTSFERFMAGYTPEADVPSIFAALCRAIGHDPEQYRQDAQQFRAIAQQLSVEQLADWREGLLSVEAASPLYDALKAIAFKATFKYSRLFCIGLYSLVEAALSDKQRDREALNAVLHTIGESLHLPAEKLRKDLELYQSNLDKLEQAKQIISDTLSADRKQRQLRVQPSAETASEEGSQPAPPSSST